MVHIIILSKNEKIGGKGMQVKNIAKQAKRSKCLNPLINVDPGRLLAY